MDVKFSMRSLDCFVQQCFSSSDNSAVLSSQAAAFDIPDLDAHAGIFGSLTCFRFLFPWKALTMLPRDSYRLLSSCCVLGFVLLAVSGREETSNAAEAPSPTTHRFELRDGDRVVLLGGTFIEREGQFGWLETELTAAFSGRRITFRNLGWSGDTVWADSRGIFEPPAVGYQKMLELVQSIQPTVIILAYGQNECFAGEAGLPAFLAQYEKLCTNLSSTKARLVFVTPLPLYSPDARLAPLKKNDEERHRYAAAIREFAATRGTVVDLGARLDECLHDWIQQQDATTLQAMYDGMHLTSAGYRWVAESFTAAAGLPVQTSIDEQQREALRREIVAKNLLYFHRWRPQNVTYLFLFRKHEQGNNAVDIPAFEELTKAADARIAALREKLPQSSAKPE